MTDDRWWAAESQVAVATIEGDLGTAFLTLHQAGAKACWKTALTPLASEQRLVDSLVAARAEYAGDVVDLVSKALGQPTYAGLLVRDLADAAEDTSMGLYHSCVAKGCTPRQAIERVGLVYGVPRHELGQFAKVAGDPKTAMPVLVDTADRVLMAYGARLMAEEANEPVSKAAAVLERTELAQFNRLHPRDELGQFARVGEDNVSTPPVDLFTRIKERLAGPEVAAQPAEPKSLVRTSRKQRTTRAQIAVAAKPEEAKQQVKTLANAKTKVAPALRAVKGRPITDKARLKALEAFGSEDLPEDIAFNPHAPIESHFNEAEYKKIDKDIEIIVPNDQAQRLLRNANWGPFRMHALTGGRNYSTVAVAGSESAYHRGQEQRNQLMQHPVYENAESPYDTVALENYRSGIDGEISEYEIEQNREEIERKINKQKAKKNEDPVTVTAYINNGNVEFSAVTPRREPGDTSGSYPVLPSLSRFVIDAGDAKGLFDESLTRGSYDDVKLAPNQGWQAHLESRVDDPYLGVPVNTYKLRPINDEAELIQASLDWARRPRDVGKADVAVLEGTSLTQFNRLHPRDQVGQFTRLSALGVAAPRETRPAPAARLTRQTRKVRRQAAAPAPAPKPRQAAARPAALSTTPKLSPRDKAKARTLVNVPAASAQAFMSGVAQETVAAKKTDLVTLEAGKHAYHVLVGDDAADFKTRLAANGFLEVGKSYRFDSDSLEFAKRYPETGIVASSNLDTAPEVHFAINQPVDLDETALHEGDDDESYAGRHDFDAFEDQESYFTRPLGRQVVGSDDWEAVERLGVTAKKMLDGNPTLSMVNLTSRSIGRGRHEYTISGAPVAPASILIEQDESYTPPAYAPGEGDIVLTYLGEVRSGTLNRSWQRDATTYTDPGEYMVDPDEFMVVSNPVMIFRMTQT